MARFVVAITGGIASGKSELARQFESLAVTVVDADVAARSVVAAGQPALTEIFERFGPTLRKDDGELDRGRLREIIFADDQAKRDLEAITHPRIRQLLAEQCAAAGGTYALVAIPLLTEGGGKTAYPWLQRILVVDTPIEIQRARLIARDRVDYELAERMIAAQASRSQRLAIADDIVINDADAEDLQAPAQRLDALYRQLAIRSG